ncbi:flagellar hook-associated protein FlgK [Sphingorhabdus sp.]|uniref:flagellar hook-associated protein FlgK n=1 Tax=Sphingorhabdus sp. TaxID=1902408 RepID=UPI00391CAC3E
MSDLLAIGASGVKAYSRALSVVGDNIANAQTDGYVRRTVRLEEAPAAGDIVLSRNSIRPGGVIAAGVTRELDQWLVDDARTASGEAARQSTRLNWISATERALDNGGNSISGSVTAIFATADQLSANPNDATLRLQFLASVDDSASAFRRTAAALGSAANGVATEAQSAVDQLNTDLSALSRVNDGLRRARAGSSNEATLLDERDRLVGNIASAMDVEVSYDARGAAIVRTPSGDPLVEGDNVATVTLNVSAAGLVSFGISPATLLQPASGALAGLTDAANHISSQRAGLDSLATQLSNTLNAAHQAGIDANGNPGAALLNFSGSAAGMTSAALAIAEVAAANALGSNGNILAFNAVRTSSGIEQNSTAFITQQAQMTAAARAQEAAASGRRDGAFAARDAIGAVDLDREAADLLRFQQAYEAAARTIQVARETMQTMLNIF